MKKFNMLLCAAFFATNIFSQTVSTFENLTLAIDTFWDGSDLSGGFTSGNASFANDYDTAFHSWSGFVYTNKKDSITAGYSNQYSAITASGYNGSANYAVAYDYGNTKVRLNGIASQKSVKGFYVTNTTYAYRSMVTGDAFAKKFGGTTGTDQDWFLLRVLGWKNGALKQQTVDFFLADFRSADSTQDYIIHDWTWVDLQLLGDVDSILFNLSSSDTTFGYMNTPGYFAMDNFTAIPTSFCTTNYLNDTLINVLGSSNDTSLIVALIGTPLIPGAADSVIGNKIYYTPAVGIVATDTLLYTVCKGANICSTEELIVTVTGITSVEELVADGLQFTVYPNPFSVFAVCNFKFAIEKPASLLVFDETGTEIFNETVTSANYQISTANWAAGIYFVKLISGKGTFVKKIVKQ